VTEHRGGVLLATVLCLAPGSAAAERLAPDAEVRAILKERVDSKRSAGIVVGILDEGGRRVVAYADAGSADRPLDGNTVFEIGSITKVFTSSLLADMVRRGEVKLDDPVSKYLPASVRLPSRNGREITLLDLATQTSGLPRLPGNMAPKDPKNPYADYSVEQLYDFLSHYTLTRDIGEKYEYSNLGVGLLGHILARRAGVSYEELLTKRILEPLEMRDTAITLSAPMKARLAPGHDAGGAAAENWDLPALAGAGALRSAANDMLKFLAANLDTGDGPLASELRETHRVRRSTGMPELDIGLGWHVFHRFGADLTWHNGGTGGYHSWIGFLAKKRAGAVVLSNSSADIDDIGLHLLEPKFPLSQAPKERKQASVSADRLEACVGEYQLSPAFSITVTREGNALFIQATGQPKLPIYSESETEFFLKAMDAQITFVGNEGRVTSLVLHQNGRDTPGKKIK
jgi:D-alanyl-D-alanine-carboxypeptidase/D-alanyl-D-alanine-endopeptidase